MGGTVRSGGNVGWRILIAPGTRTPLGNPAARPVTTLRSAADVDNDKYGEIRRTELTVTPDLPYTVLVRGFDAEGNLSPWSAPGTGATRTGVGTRLDQQSSSGTWRSVAVPGSTQSEDAALTVEPSGVAHVFNDRVAIPNTRADDENLQLAAQSRTRVVVGWNHKGFSVNEQGVWTSWRTYDRAGRATTAGAARRTKSAYDRLDGVAVDAGGSVSVLYRRR